MKDNVIKIQEPVKLIARQEISVEQILQSVADVNQDEAIKRNTIGELNEPDGEEKDSED